MAAYAAVVSLMNIMEQIRNHPRLPTSFDPNQIESLGENLDSLLDFVEHYSVHGFGSNEMEDLEMQIASAAHAAEDVIESHVVDQIRAGFEETSPSFLIDLQSIIEDMNLIKEEIVRAKGARQSKDEQSKDEQPPAAPSRPLISGNTFMVGFDEVLIQLMDRLTGPRSDLEIVPIVGPGGIGKTTLARNAYEHSLIEQYFDYRAWANVSQELNVRKVFLQLLSCLGQSIDQLVEYTENELGGRLYQILSGRRYLIVVDDMWDISSWDLIKYFFPDNKNGSRVIVTTRLSGLASQLSFSGLEIQFLNEYQSWGLFCTTVFANEDCPLELEEIGRNIVRYCRGLPLSIVVIGGLLRTSPRTREYWEYVEENIGSILNSEDDNRLHKVLMLSYNALPAYLKPCFLYMGIFPQDHEFRVSRVIKLLVAEGFLKPKVGQTLEDVGESCIQELIDRNLILVSSKGSKGRAKTCKLHDLMRDLCLRLVEKKKFFCLMKPVGTPQEINSDRRFVVHEEHVDPQFFHAMESTLLARSLICKSPAAVSFKSRLLRVLIEVYSDSLDSTFQQVNLRFLSYEKTRAPIGWILTYELPSSLSQLWNVQTLIIDKKIELVVAPSEIWGMRLLRHLEFYRVRLPEPPASDDEDDSALPNLQTLGTVLDFKCSEEVCKRMPNIKKLRVFYDDFSEEGQTSSWYCIENLSLFHKLESLHLHYCFHIVPNRDDLLKNLKFPHSLRKLILQDCQLHWNDLSTIGWLPSLEVLKLKRQSVRGPRWNLVEGQFVGLRILEIDSCDLIYWEADSSHFPLLEKLVLVRLYKLNEIPSEIGEVPTLREICVVECSISAAISAVRILQVEQEECGNTEFQVRVRFRKEEELAEFTAKVELEGLTTSNLQTDRV